MATSMLSQQFAAQRSVAPARARRSAVVRASAEAPEAATPSKPDATVYFTNKAGARITGNMEQARAAAAHPKAPRRRPQPAARLGSAQLAPAATARSARVRKF